MLAIHNELSFLFVWVIIAACLVSVSFGLWTSSSNMIANNLRHHRILTSSSYRNRIVIEGYYNTTNLEQYCPHGFVLPDNPDDPDTEWVNSTECARACLSPVFSDKQWSQMDALYGLLSWLGEIGLIFLTLTLLAARERERITYLVVGAVVLAAIPTTINVIMTLIPLEKRVCRDNANGYGEADGFTMCALQSVASLYGSLGLIYVWAVQVINIFIVIVLNKPDTIRAYQKQYQLIVYGLPVVSVAVMLGKGYYGFAKGCCPVCFMHEFTGDTDLYFFFSILVAVTGTCMCLFSAVIAKVLPLLAYNIRYSARVAPANSSSNLSPTEAQLFNAADSGESWWGSGFSSGWGYESVVSTNDGAAPASSSGIYEPTVCSSDDKVVSGSSDGAKLPSSDSQSGPTGSPRTHSSHSRGFSTSSGASVSSLKYANGIDNAVAAAELGVITKTASVEKPESYAMAKNEALPIDKSSAACVAMQARDDNNEEFVSADGATNKPPEPEDVAPTAAGSSELIKLEQVIARNRFIAYTLNIITRLSTLRTPLVFVFVLLFISVGMMVGRFLRTSNEEANDKGQLEWSTCVFDYFFNDYSTNAVGDYYDIEARQQHADTHCGITPSRNTGGEYNFFLGWFFLAAFGIAIFVSIALIRKRDIALLCGCARGKR